MTHQVHPIVLHIDDDPDDRMLIAEAVKKIDPSITVVPAASGEEGLHYLYALQQEHKLPCLTIVDMNMPGIDGREVVGKMRQDAVLKAIPVIILTTCCDSEADNLPAELQVKCIAKPASVRLLEATMTDILSYCKFR
ncbi:MAG TPA: response regulator [Chitinophagaceae bacterium]